jgi:hypothetical protein
MAKKKLTKKEKEAVFNAIKKSLAVFAAVNPKPSKK